VRRIDSSVTVEEQAFQEIRRAILTGHLAPGERLRLRELSSELNVSSLPVRAALGRLRAEGLVVHAARSGSVVAPIEYEELEEIQAFRLGIECLAARLGAERIDARDLDRMARQLDVVSEVAREHDLERYLRAESAFREICFRASGRDRLVAHVVDYRLRAERYLRVAFSSPRGLAHSVGFQRTLLKACAEHDGDAAERVTEEALNWTKEAMRRYFAEQAAAEAATPTARGGGRRRTKGEAT
jgi:DNA-binding GntR family transcriptional regulator